MARRDAGSRILVVGAGPGVTTEEMMARGWSFLVVVPGAPLARIARDEFGDERFAVEVNSFDEWRGAIGVSTCCSRRRRSTGRPHLR